LPRDGTKNLIPVQSEQEAKEKGRKGGVASGEARRRKKAQKDYLKLLLELKPDLTKLKKEQQAIFSLMGIDVENIETNGQLKELMLFKQAMNGDVGAIKYIDERMGINPQLELRRREVESKIKSEQADTTTIDLVANLLLAVENQADGITKGGEPSEQIDNTTDPEASGIHQES